MNTYPISKYEYIYKYIQVIDIMYVGSEITFLCYLHTGTEMSIFTETFVKSCMVTKRIYIFLQHVFVGVMVD